MTIELLQYSNVAHVREIVFLLFYDYYRREKRASWVGTVVVALSDVESMKNLEEMGSPRRRDTVRRFNVAVAWRYTKYIHTYYNNTIIYSINRITRASMTYISTR